MITNHFFCEGQYTTSESELCNDDSETFKQLNDISKIDKIRNHKSDDSLRIIERIIEGHYFNYYINKKVLGVGAYSVVYSGTIESESNGTLPKHLQDIFYVGQDIAIKKIDISQMNEDDLRFVLTEENISRMLMHHTCENIVQILDVIRTNSTVYIVMEVLTGSTLTSVLIKPMKDEYVRFYLSQIVNALIYLRNKNIIHGDVKPDNILMTHDHKMVKLCDFGFSSIFVSITNVNYNFRKDSQLDLMIIEQDLSTIIHNSSINNNDIRSKLSQNKRVNQKIVICGSPIYMAPEIRTIEYTPDFGIDIWSLGMVLHEMIFGYHPFRGIKDSRSVTEAIPKLQINRTNLIGAENQGIYLLKSMLVIDAIKRASIENLATNEWLVPLSHNINSSDISTSLGNSTDSSDTEIDRLNGIQKSDSDFEIPIISRFVSKPTRMIPMNFESIIHRRFKSTRNNLKLSDIFHNPKLGKLSIGPTSNSCPSSFTPRTSDIAMNPSMKPHRRFLTSTSKKPFSLSGTEISYKKVPIESVIFGSFFGEKTSDSDCLDKK